MWLCAVCGVCVIQQYVLLCICLVCARGGDHLAASCWHSRSLLLLASAHNCTRHAPALSIRTQLHTTRARAGRREPTVRQDQDSLLSRYEAGGNTRVCVGGSQNIQSSSDPPPFPPRAHPAASTAALCRRAGYYQGSPGFTQGFRLVLSGMCGRSRPSGNLPLRRFHGMYT